MTWLLEKFDYAINNPVQAVVVGVLLAGATGTAVTYLVMSLVDFIHRHGGAS